MSVEPLWSVEAMAQAMRAERAGALPAGATGISIDSRSIAQARRSSPSRATTATATPSSRQRSRPAPARRHRADRRAALPRDARPGRARRARSAPRPGAGGARASPAQIIGVTGSVGKTSTKEALRLALSADGETHASAASYNNHWGVPLSLARCPQTPRYAVFEIGMNHAGEIAP